MSIVFKWCWLGRHSPNRRNARWDGARYVSSCKHCDKAIARVRHGKWVADHFTAAH